MQVADSSANGTPGEATMIPKRQPTTRATTTRSTAQVNADSGDQRATAGPRPATYELIERITSLQLKMVPLEVLAETVVGPLLDAFMAPAGGLLLYHSEDSSLRLIASRGLSTAGREHLASLRAGAAGGWEIPLHGLLNRKAYIIERPHEHPFVPELVERDETKSPVNLACIPLYRGQLPVGVLLVIADRRPVTNTEVMTHVLVYDVLALALDAGLRSRGEPPLPMPERDAELLACDEWTDPRDTARTLEQQLAIVTGERIELAERVAVLEAAHQEARGLLTAQKTLHRELLESERAEAARKIAELEQAMADEVARARQVAEQARANERAGLDEQLALERNAAASTIRELESTLADREAAFAGALQKLQTALNEREIALAEREAELRDLGGERDRVRLAASEAGDVVRGLHAEVEKAKAAQADAEAEHARAFAEAQAAFERQLAELTVEHRRALERVETSHGSAVGDLRAAEARLSELAGELAAVRDEVQSLRAERSQVLAALDAPGVEPATAVRGLHHQIATSKRELHERSTALAELERRLVREAEAAEQRQSAQRREFHEVHAQHERELDELAATHRNALEEMRAAARREAEQAEAAQRAHLAEIQAEAQHKVELERFDAQQRLDAFRMESRAALDGARAALADVTARAAAAEARVEVLVEELNAVRAEAARLAEERAHVLAAVDDPNAEPATVIRALRDQVAALEGQVGMITAERSAVERQLVADAQAADTRLAEMATAAEARAAELRAAAQASLDDARRAAETTLAELRTALAERDAQLATHEQTLRALADDRDQTRRMAAETSDALRRSLADGERIRAELANSEEAVRGARTSAATTAARLAELEREHQAVRGELARLHEERARVLAAVDRDGSDAEPVAVIRALREQTVALEAQVRALTDDRNAMAERGSAERAALEAKLAAVEAERTAAEAQRGAQTGRIAALERELIRSEEMLASARRQLDAAVERVRTHVATDRPAAPEGVTPATPVAATAAHGATPPSVDVASAVPRVEVLSPPPAPVVEAGAHRILEGDPLVRERLAAALEAELPADTASTLFVANLLSALPDRLAEVAAAAETGSTLVTYAASGGRSRILGAVRCFTAGPEPEVMAPMLAKLGGQRRLISLSDDVDGLIPLKAALSKGGHSISMACDPKQALDLLGMLTPDAVLVDLRTSPENAAAFLDALALETGRTPAFLICGDDPGTTLRRAIEPLLRATPLDASQLAKVCQTILAPPAAESATRNAGTRVVRPLDRKTPPASATRKPVPRRVLTKRR
jgi:chromosome segregation ATPase